MLENYVEEENQVKNSLTADLLAFYNQMDDLLHVINEYLKEDVHENLKNWKENHNWFHLYVFKLNWTFAKSFLFKNKLSLSLIAAKQ